jgi:hypothetical protein
MVHDPDRAHARYKARKLRKNQRVFLDGAHFQLPWAQYPAPFL